MRKIRLTIEYEGTRYAGWQIQPNGLAVQQVMEEALMSLLGEQVRLQSSGRTDAGVHALGMVAAFSTTTTLPLRAYVDGTNRFLPPDIVVRDAMEVPLDFNPIANAKSKHYRYTIYNTFVRSPLMRMGCWHVREPLDLAAMQIAAESFVGRHDFASFRASNCATKTTERSIYSMDVHKSDALIQIDVVGEGFLKNMVRIMAGTLVDVGRKRFAPEYVGWLLLNPDRKKAGVTAPACGLCLMGVVYGEEVHPE